MIARRSLAAPLLALLAATASPGAVATRAEAATPVGGAAATVAQVTCATLVEVTTEGLPQGLAEGADGRLWLTYESIPHGVQAISPTSGASQIFPLPQGPPPAGTPAFSAPRGMASGFGKLWFVDALQRRVARMSTSGVLEVTVQLPPGRAPADIVTGPDGNVWFTMQGSPNRIGRLPPSLASGSLEQFTVPTAAAGVLGITAGPDGNLWFAESAAGRIGRITPAGSITEFALGPGASPQRVASANAAVWFTDSGRNSIGRLDPATGAVTEFAIPTAGAVPQGLTGAPDGGIWFAETAGQRIARLNPATGVINETPVSVLTQNPNPRFVVSRADGTIWFTENAQKLGHFKVDLNGQVQPLPPEVALAATGPQTIVGGQTVYSTQTQLTVSVTNTGTCADSISYRFFPTGNTAPAYTTVLGNSVTFQLPANGSWTIEFFATGPGGIAPTTTTSALVDNSQFPDLTPPTISVPANITVNATAPTTPVSFTVTAADPESAVTVSCTTPTAPPTLVVSGTTWSGSFPPGTKIVTCVATNAAGLSDSGSFSVTVNVPPPTLMLPADITLPATGPLTPVTLTATATSLVSGPRQVNCLLPGGDQTSFGAFSALFPPGLTAVACATSDPHGNTVSGTFNVTITVPAPTLALPAPITVLAAGPSGAMVHYSATASSIAFPSVPVSCDPESGSSFPVGATTVACTATDPLGQSSAGSFLVTVLPPPIALVLPADISVTTFRASGRPVSFTASAFDAQGAITPVCEPPSGSLFGVGVTTVTCTATRGSASVSGAFTIAVVLVPAPDAIVVLDPRGEKTFRKSGAGEVSASGGGIQVNSRNRRALTLSGSGDISAPYIRIVGGFRRGHGDDDDDEHGLPLGDFSVPPETGAAAVPDPYAGLGTPGTTGLPVFRNVKIKGNGDRTLGPGVYDSIKIEGSGTVTIRPGIYILRGGGLEVKGSRTLELDPAATLADGVLFFNAGKHHGSGKHHDDEDRHCGDVEFEGTVTVSLRASANGPFAGLTIYQDRACKDEISVGGSVAMTIGGIYAATARFEVEESASVRVDGRIVVHQFRFRSAGGVSVEP